MRASVCLATADRSLSPCVRERLLTSTGEAFLDSTRRMHGALVGAMEPLSRSLVWPHRSADTTARCSVLPLLLVLSSPRRAMGNSYNLHKACPEQNARFLHCQRLFFENKFVPLPPIDANGVQPPRVVQLDGVPVSNPADIALTLEALEPGSMNSACRDLWQDYKECVEGVMKEKQQDYLKRKEAKKAAAAPAQNQTPADAEKPKQ